MCTISSMPGTFSLPKIGYVVECLLFEPNKPQLNVRISLRKNMSFSLSSVRAFMGRHSYRNFNSWDACHVTEAFEQKFNGNSLVEQISTEEFHLGCHSNGALSDHIYIQYVHFMFCYSKSLYYFRLLCRDPMHKTQITI